MIDIVAIKKGSLHKKSKFYKHMIRHTNNVHAGLNNNPKKENVWKIRCRFLKDWYNKWFGTDATGWIIRMIVTECIEIIIQTNALLLYNGFHNKTNPDNADDVYLVKKPEFIKLYAGLIAVNCMGSGIIWLLYACIPSFCHGIKFKLSVFIVDQCADVM